MRTLNTKLESAFFGLDEDKFSNIDSHGEVFSDTHYFIEKTKPNNDDLFLMAYGIESDDETCKEKEKRAPKIVFTPLGLYSEQIFGTSIQERKTRFGHIFLSIPCINFVFSKGTINVVSFLIGMPQQKLKHIIYDNAFFCTNVGAGKFINRNSILLPNSGFSFYALTKEIKDIIKNEAANLPNIEKANIVLWKLINVIYPTDLTEQLINDCLLILECRGIFFKRGIMEFKNYLDYRQIFFPYDIERLNRILCSEEIKDCYQTSTIKARIALINNFIKQKYTTDSLFFSRLPVIPVETRNSIFDIDNNIIRIDSFSIIYDKIIKENNKIKKLFSSFNKDQNTIDNCIKTLQEVVDVLVANEIRDLPLKNKNGTAYSSIMSLTNTNIDDINKELFGENVYQQIKQFNDEEIKKALDFSERYE